MEKKNGKETEIEREMFQEFEFNNSSLKVCVYGC